MQSGRLTRDALFDSKYPQISEGDAFVQKSGNTWLMYNSNDRDNFNQDATLLLAGDTFQLIIRNDINVAGGNDFALDNILLENTPTTNVPEPLTLSLFGAGLAGAAALRRRKKAA